jgi:dephospho-CoA kinase
LDRQPDWRKLTHGIEQLMRLKTFPVAFKMLKKKEGLNKIPFLRRTKRKMTLCQLITLARNFKWTVGAELDDFVIPMCPSVLGFADLPETFKDGTFRSMAWVKKREDGKKYEASVPRLPLGKYEAVAMGPLQNKPFEPDIVLIYANPAQMMLLINSLQFEDYEVIEFYCVGETSCSDAIARCYLTGKPSLSIPCYGERRYGHAQDEDLAMAIPAGMMEKALRGMEGLYRRGIRYPITYAGAEQDLTTPFSMVYGGLDQMEGIRGKDNRLLLGVTGGIATGKTTVVRILEELGAPVIDFDILARQVVEPGKPAWQEIIDYFGEQVLQEDKNLDRKKLSDIVFNDIEKRKKLESFTHPRIHAQFMAQLGKIVEKDPDAIVQVDVPLLIEGDLQYMFHKTLVVYVPEEKQIERLMERDGISKEEAAERLKAQLPIDEKVGYADFVIYNDKSLEETRRQVEEVWETLKKIQKEKAK